MKSLLTLFLFSLFCSPALCAADSYAVAQTATPILNTPAFRTIFGGRNGASLKTDRCGQVKELEFVALPGTVFTIRSEIKDGVNTIFRVETDDYPNPPGVSLYLDSRFVELRNEKSQPRTRQLPPEADIMSSLKEAIGSPYVWGGNLQDGVIELHDLFYGGMIPHSGIKRLSLAGLDCSGLLYQATGGWTPRNTSHLVSFGIAVHIAGRSVKEIAGMLKPLDLIVWNGHLLIVMDRETVIESRLECGRRGNGGVVTSPLQKRLAEIMRTRRPANSWPGSEKKHDVFVVRRWL